MKRKFYLYNGEVWYSEDKKLRFVKVSDPETSIEYAKTDPDVIEGFREIVPSPATYERDAPQERLYRVITDLSTVIFLNEDSFRDINRNVSSYLQEIEEWERMCIVRDITEFYTKSRGKRKAEVEDFIRSHEKPAAKD